METHYLTNYFITKDLFLSALLYAKGVKIQRVDRKERICWFVFENKEACDQFQRGFITKTIEVNAKEYADAVRTLKDIVFAE